jgi:hypothetical protein
MTHTLAINGNDAPKRQSLYGALKFFLLNRLVHEGLTAGSGMQTSNPWVFS